MTDAAPPDPSAAPAPAPAGACGGTHAGAPQAAQDLPTDRRRAWRSCSASSCSPASARARVRRAPRTRAARRRRSRRRTSVRSGPSQVSVPADGGGNGTPAVLMFFGAWCTSCQQELPPLTTAVRRQNKAGGSRCPRIRSWRRDSFDGDHRYGQIVHGERRRAVPRGVRPASRHHERSLLLQG